MLLAAASTTLAEEAAVHAERRDHVDVVWSRVSFGLEASQGRGYSNRGESRSTQVKSKQIKRDHLYTACRKTRAPEILRPHTAVTCTHGSQSHTCLPKPHTLAKSQSMRQTLTLILQIMLIMRSQMKPKRAYL